MEIIITWKQERNCFFFRCPFSHESLQSLTDLIMHVLSGCVRLCFWSKDFFFFLVHFVFHLKLSATVLECGPASMMWLPLDLSQHWISQRKHCESCVCRHTIIYSVKSVNKIWRKTGKILFRKKVWNIPIRMICSRIDRAIVKRKTLIKVWTYLRERNEHCTVQSPNIII